MNLLLVSLHRACLRFYSAFLCRLAAGDYSRGRRDRHASSHRLGESARLYLSRPIGGRAPTRPHSGSGSTPLPPLNTLVAAPITGGRSRCSRLHLVQRNLMDCRCSPRPSLRVSSAGRLFQRACPPAPCVRARRLQYPQALRRNLVVLRREGPDAVHGLLLGEGR